MIAKKILNPKKASPKHVRISRLAAYIRAPERDDTTEKCVYAGARGFHARTPAGQTCEMVALAEDAVRSRDPVTHYVFSWPTGERPTPDQVEEAVTILLDEMAIPDHQAIYGLHADTAHHHLHVLVNRAHPVPRIHPVTGELETRVVKINRGFDIEAAHRAGARIEHAQGWRIEANKRYRIAGIGADGKPVLERTDPEANHRRRNPSQQQIDAELRTGKDSVARRVIELLAPILGAAAGWSDWHERLDAHGIRYARKGSGAVFILDGIGIKASRVDRRATLRTLEQRFGAYQAREPARTPAPLPCDIAPFFTKLLADVETAGAGSTESKKWDLWHAGVEAGGYGYRRKGSGAVIVTGHGVFKASDVSRRITRAALEKSFGPYREPPAGVSPAPAAAPPAPEISDPRDAAPRLAALLAKVDDAGDRKWERWHAGVEALGGRYQRKGSGAVIAFGGITVRATDVLRGLSLGALQKRFGLYEPPAGPVPERPAERANLPEHGPYLQAREAHRCARDADWIAYERQYERDLKDLRRKQAVERNARLDARQWTGRGRHLNAERSILAARHEAERAELRERRRRAREERRRRFPPWPSYEDWVRDRALLPAEQRWAHPATSPAWLEGARDERPTPRDIRAYLPRAIGRVVVYRHRDTPDRIAFTDLGRRICVHAPQDESAVLASLQLAAQKWGRVRVRGSPAFQALSVRLAVRHGIAITNPELQDQIRAERAEYRKSIRVAPMARPVEIPARTPSDRHAEIPPAPVAAIAARPVETPARTPPGRHAEIPPPVPAAAVAAQPVEIPAQTSSDRQAPIPATPVASAPARPLETGALRRLRRRFRSAERAMARMRKRLYDALCERSRQHLLHGDPTREFDHGIRTHDIMWGVSRWIRAKVADRDTPDANIVSESVLPQRFRAGLSVLRKRLLSEAEPFVPSRWLGSPVNEAVQRWERHWGRRGEAVVRQLAPEIWKCRANPEEEQHQAARSFLEERRAREADQRKRAQEQEERELSQARQRTHGLQSGSRFRQPAPTPDQRPGTSLRPHQRKGGGQGIND